VATPASDDPSCCVMAFRGNRTGRECLPWFPSR